jgi:hypothetical protein
MLNYQSVISMISPLNLEFVISPWIVPVASIVSNQFHPHLIVPKSTRDQILQKMTVDLAIRAVWWAEVGFTMGFTSQIRSSNKRENAWNWVLMCFNPWDGNNSNSCWNTRKTWQQMCLCVRVISFEGQSIQRFFWGCQHWQKQLHWNNASQVAIPCVENSSECQQRTNQNEKKQNNPWPTLFRLKSSVSPGFPPFCHLGLHKFTGQNPADVQVLRVGFERLVVSQDLCSAGGGHRSHQQAVAKSMLGLRKTKLQVRSVSDRPTKPQ